MEFTAFMQWAFLGIVSAGVSILYQMKGSMNDLNVKFAVFVERLENHQEKLDKLESRFDKCTRECHREELKKY